MTDIRSLYLSTIVELSMALTDQRGVLAEHFESPSALAEFSVRGLAGHLRRAMTSVETYLDQGPPAAGDSDDVLSAAEYYATVIPDDRDLDSDFNRAIRQRGLEAAPDSSDEFILAFGETAAGLVARLEQEPADRLVQVYGGLVMTLDQYLVTRLVELVVHADDLAASLEIAPFPTPAGATGLVITTLVEVARIRHGDAAAVRALTRRERDTIDALRVL